MSVHLESTILTRLAVDDYVQLKVWQNSGGNLDVLGSSRNDTPILWAAKISD